MRIFLILSLFFNSLCFGAPLCKQLFSKGKITGSSSLLINENLKAYGYEVVEDEVYKNINDSRILIGRFEVIRPKYLFEWADESMHKYWLRNGKYTSKDMTYMLAQKGQASGRGYYVSLDPTDSIDYGTHLTIYEVSQPLFIFEQFGDFTEDPAILNELRQIGFSGIQGIKGTWLNIFNESVLEKPTAVNEGILAFVKKEFPNSYARLLTCESIRSLVDQKIVQIPLSKLKKGLELTKDEQTTLSQDFEYDPEKYLQLLISKKINLSDINKFLANLDVKSIDRIRSKVYEETFSKFYKMISNSTSVESFFDLFDLTDIALLENTKIKESLTYQIMIETSKKYAESLARVDFKKIKTPSEFTTSLREVFHFEKKLDFQIRNFDVVMSPLQKTKNLTISFNSEVKEQILRNSYLHANEVRSFQYNDKQFYEYEVGYLGLDNYLKSASRLLTDEEVIMIKSLRKKKTADAEAKATEKLISIVFDKFFNPKYFSNLCAAVGEREVTALNLYKAFVSLHPFIDGNGRAAHIYYRWLVANHFHEDFPVIANVSNEFDIFESSVHGQMITFYHQDWLFSRLWVMSAKTEDEMKARAKRVLKFGGLQSSRVGKLYELSILLNESP